MPKRTSDPPVGMREENPKNHWLDPCEFPPLDEAASGGSLHSGAGSSSPSSSARALLTSSRFCALFDHMPKGRVLLYYEVRLLCGPVHCFQRPLQESAIVAVAEVPGRSGKS